MANLTEEHGLRKLVSIEQFNKESAVKKEPGIVGRLVRWLFGDTGGSSQQPKRLTEDQVQVLNELELGTQVGLRREEWDDYRVMIVDQRLRVLPITGLQTITSDFQCDVVVDVNVAYKVMDVNYVAFGVEDPLKMLQDKVIDLVLEAISKIPVIDLLKNQNNIASLIKNLGRIPETGLEVMDARVNIVPPHEVLDQIGRATKALIDAEAMIKEKEAKANVLERIDKTDFDSEERRVKNEASLRALQDSFEQAREIKGLVHAQTKEEKDANFKRRQALADEEHRLTILNKRLDAYAGVLERVGVNPKLAILMMDDTPWRLFFERFQSIGEEHNSQRLETIHEQINTLITTKQLPDESIAKLMDLLEEESKNLGGRPSIMKQFESFLEDSNSTPRLADSSIPKTEAGPETAIEHEYDNDAQRNIEEKIEDATSNHDDDTQSKLSQFERLYYERSPQSLNEARLIGQELLQTATLSVIDRTRIREYMKKIDDAISKEIFSGGSSNDDNQVPVPPHQGGSDVKVDYDNRNFKISVSWPLLLSKRFGSVFLCQIYLPEGRPRVVRNIKAELGDQLSREENRSSKIKFGQRIIVIITSQDISFSEPVTKTINEPVIKAAFLGKPNDDCEPGFHHSIKASIVDTGTGEEFDYIILSNVRVVDFAFDHVSRPLISRVSAVVLGIGSLAMFILTSLEQVDKTFGLTSGTAVGILAGVIYLNFYNVYGRIRPDTP